MKRIISVLTAMCLMATVFYVPSATMVYADNKESITYYDICDADISLSETELEYTGEAQVPETIKVEYDSVLLKEDTDYILHFENNRKPGIATIIVTGIGDYTGTQNAYFEIKDADESKFSVSIPYDNYTYTGKEIRPIPTVKYENVTLKENDYTVKYSNNIYPGLAQLEIYINGSDTPIIKEFFIAKIKTFKVVATTTTSIKLQWARMYNVTGYEIYTYDFSKGKWKWKKTIKGSSNTTCTITGLGAGYGYQYKVIPYVKKGTKVYYGVFSDILSAPTKPGKVALNSVTTTPKLTLTASWSKKQGSGYQMFLSRNSNFSTYSKYNITPSSKTSQTIVQLADNATYYVKVRAYRTYGDKTVYGAWSTVKSIKTKDSGWYTAGGKKYYYVNSKKALGTWNIAGNQYYFNSDTGELLGASSLMWNKVKGQSSNTSWLAAVSTQLNRVCVYKKENGSWVLKYYWKCTDGAKATPTPKGIYTTPKTKPRLRYFGEGLGYTCWYATRIVGSIYFHSVLYNTNSQTSIQDGRLGYSLSHGCIRLAKTNALWLYNNIKPGTKVVIY